MAKKDDTTKRIEIPTDILNACNFLDASKKPAFYLDKNLGAVFLANSTFSFPSESHFLGYCDFNTNTRTICLPENVERALGHSKEYYFATDAHTGSCRLYIYTVKS